MTHITAEELAHLILEGNFSKALNQISSLSRISESDINHLIASLKKVLIYSNIDEIHALAISLLEYDESHPDLLIFKANLEIKTGQVYAALDSYEKLLHITDGQGAVIARYAHALNEIGRPIDAIELMDEYPEGRSHRFARAVEAESLNLMYRPIDACKLFDDQLNLDELLVLIDSNYILLNHSNVTNLTKKAILLNKSHPRVAKWNAYCLSVEEKYEESLTILLDSLQQNPYSVDLLLEISKLYIRGNQYSGAKEYLERLNQYYSYRGDVLGEILMAQRLGIKIQKSTEIDILAPAMSIEKYNHRLPYYIAQIKCEAGDIKELEPHLTGFMDNCQDILFISLYVKILMEKGDFEKALSHNEKAVSILKSYSSLHKQAIDIYLDNAYIKYALDMKNEALEAFNFIESDIEHDIDAKYVYALALYENQEKSKAKKIFDSIQEADPDYRDVKKYLSEY